MKTQQNKLPKILYLIALACLIVKAQELAYNDQIQAYEAYKENVCTGVHLDFKKLGVTCED